MPLCQNAHCGHDVTTLRPISVDGHGKLKLCSECCSHAVRNGQLRSVEDVQRSDLMKRRRQKNKVMSKGSRDVAGRPAKVIKGSREVEPRVKTVTARVEKKSKSPTRGPLEKCENPSCGKLAKLGRIVTGDGELRVCASCGCYWRRNGVLRSAERLKKYKDIMERRKEKGKVCSNPNCQALLDVVENADIDAELATGGYARCDGKYYCVACAHYLDIHDGEQRPRRLVEKQNRRKASIKVGGLRPCDNKNCGAEVGRVVEVKTEDDRWIHLCSACYSYLKIHGEMRPPKAIKKSSRRKAIRKPKGDRCANRNCRSIDLEYGGYSEFDGEYYCQRCKYYLTLHDGEQRPEWLVKKHPVHFMECENPNCKVQSAHLRPRNVEGYGLVMMCKVCAGYTRLNGFMRSAEMIRKAEQAANPAVCHNANCGEKNVTRGGYSKRNGEYYCTLCARYFDQHGEERPVELVEQCRLRKSRYLWKKNHPWEKDEQE